MSAIHCKNTIRRIARAAVVTLGLLSLWAAPAHAAQDPTEFIDGLAGEAFATLRDESISETDRFNKFRALLSQGVDLKRVGRFVLGVHWRRANQAQRAEYDMLFGDYVIALYAGRLQSYSNADVIIKGTTSSGRGEHVVTTMVSEPNAVEPIRVDWRVRESDGRMQIIDIIIEGISMAISQRSEFASVIRGNGGDMSTLLTRLRRIAEANPKPDKISAAR